MVNKQRVIVWLIIAVFLMACAVSVFAAGSVEINYSITDYLDEETDTKAALEIINSEFGMNSDIKVMVSDIDRDKAAEISKELSAIEGVIGVTFGDDSYKDRKALFTVMLDGDEYSSTATRVAEEIHSLLDDRFADRVEYGGTVISNINLREVITEEMVYILGISVCLVIIILLISARSWLEPFVLLLASAVAVIINAGTNIIYGEISYITNAVAAILQLALSIDYSIALLHAYRRLKNNNTNSYMAMLSAIKEVARPVSASGLTTIAGLLALLFMSFGIGFDIGMVLMKGFVTALTLFPALILVFEKPMEKTGKKALRFTGKGLCTFAFKHGKGAICVFLALLMLFGVLRNGVDYDFTVSLGEENTIADTFGANSTVMLVYENGDDNMAAETAFVERIGKFKRDDGTTALLSCTAYSNTVGEIYDVEKAVSKLGVEKSHAEMLFGMYYLYGAPDIVKMSVAEFINYTSELLDRDEVVKAFASELASPVKTMAMAINLHTYPIERQRTAEGLLDYVSTSYGISVDAEQVEAFYKNAARDTMSLAEAEALFGADSEALRADMALYDALNKQYGYMEISEHVVAVAGAFGGTEVAADSVSVEYVSGIYVKYVAENLAHEFKGVAAEELLKFININMGEGTLLSAVFTDDHKNKINSAMSLLAAANELFVGDEHTRLLMYLDLPAEGADTEAFMEEAIAASKDAFGKAYLAGLIPSTYDLQKTFDYDNRIISIVTIVCIFLIVMIIFRSLSLPVILVAVIQCAIWLVLSAAGVLNVGIFFMSYIMSSCILMGATIDYGILMSSSYVSARKTVDKKEALMKAMEAALPTVFTSGMTMSVAGFVIYFIASQNAISTTGLLIGIGTVAASVFVTLVLPSMLYVLDKLVLRLTMGTKGKKQSCEKSAYGSEEKAAL